MEAISSCAPTDPVHNEADEADDAVLSHLISDEELFWKEQMNLEGISRCCCGCTDTYKQTHFEALCVHTTHAHEIEHSHTVTYSFTCGRVCSWARQLKSLRGFSVI